MPLILAVEPDRRRAAQLTAMARTHLDCEFLVASSGEGGIELLRGRLPDVLLTAPLMRPPDEAALERHMRERGVAASRLPTLTIPLLSTEEPMRSSGVLSRFRGERAPVERSEGCAPSVFAEQIREYLACVRSAPPMAEQIPGPPVMSMAVAPAMAETQALEPAFPAVDAAPAVDSLPFELSDFVDLCLEDPIVPMADEALSPADDEIDLCRFLEEVTLIEDKALEQQASEPEPLVVEASTAAPAQLLLEEAPRAAAAPAVAPTPRRAPTIDVEPEPAAPLTALMPAPPPVQQPAPSVQIVTIPTGDGTHVQAAVNVAVAVSVQVAAAVTVVTPAASRRSRKPKPVQDEWGFFDPTQCGFPALMARLDEIAEKEDSEQ